MATNRKQSLVTVIRNQTQLTDSPSDLNFGLTWGGQVKDGEQQKPSPSSSSERRAEAASSCQRQKQSAIHPQLLLYRSLKASLFSPQVTDEGPRCQVNIYCGTLSAPLTPPHILIHVTNKCETELQVSPGGFTLLLGQS